MRMPVGLHSTGVITHKHMLAKTLRGLTWIRFRRWTSLNPSLRDQFIDKLEELLPIMHKAVCDTCGWRGPCRYVKRMAENDALTHTLDLAPSSLIQAMSNAREQLRLSFSEPEPSAIVPVVPHREANEGDREAGPRA